MSQATEIQLDDPGHVGGSDQLLVGAAPNDTTGDPLRVGGQKLKQDMADINTMFGYFYALKNNFILASDYAIDPTGVLDSAPALNLAIQAAIARKKKLIIPSGIFLLNTPLNCFTPGSYFEKVIIEGQGSGIPVSGTTFPTGVNGTAQGLTLLCMNSKTSPAVIFQSNRGAEFRNLAIMGLNVAPFSVTEPNDTQSNYVTSGCRTSQYSPYCAIVIDPFSVTSPADGGYPGLTYNAVYSGGGSSGVLIENVHIWGFVVGVAPSIVGGSQGDLVTCRNVKIEYCDSAYACGGTQARQWQIIDGFQNTCRQFVDTRNYGVGGRSPQLVQNIVFGGCYRVFNLGGSDVCKVIDCYSESVKTWGRFGPSGAISFDGCTVGIGTTAQGWALMPPPYVFEASSPVVWKGCSIQRDNGVVYAWNFQSNSGNMTFEQCTFLSTDVLDVPPLIALDMNALNGAHLKDCWLQSFTSANSFSLSDDFTVRSYGVAHNAHNGRLHATWQTRFVQDANLTYIYQPPTSTLYVTAAATSITRTGLTLTFTESVLGSVQLNDVLLWQILAQGFASTSQVPAWIVTSHNAGTGACVATALFDVAQYDTVANAAVTFGSNTIAIVRHQWAPTQAVTGTTATDTTLTAVSPTALVNGDFVQGTGIQAGTRVVSGGGTASLVLNKATTASASGVTLYDGRLLVPTTTPAF